MRFHLTRLVTILAIHGLGSGLGWAQHGPANDRLQAAGYSECDALILGRAWSQPTPQMKDWILSKVAGGMQTTLDRDLRQARDHQRARQQLRCTYIEAGFTYADAEVLAKAWKTSLRETKDRIGWASARGARSEIIRDLKAARGGSAPSQVTTQTRNPELRAFEQSRFTQCDATLLARMWSEGVYENKKYIGMKILNGWPEAIDDFLRTARQKVGSGHIAKCAWSDTGYGYDDAQLLSREWGISVSDTKIRIANKLTWGLNEAVESGLHWARNPH